MNPLYLFLLVLLGLLGPSMSVNPRQMGVDDVSQGQVDHQNAPRGGIKGLLLDYQLVCTKDTSVDPPKGFTPGKILSDKFCRNWWDCKSDGTKYQKRAIPQAWLDDFEGWRSQSNVDWCKDNCKCELVDKPAEHASYNMGCPNPYGGYMQGSYGSVARDTGGSANDDGLRMEAFDGPPRKE